MPVEVNVGPPVITINNSNTFMVTDQNGEIEPLSEQGVFFMDTRFVSRYKIFANDQPWVRLSSSAVAYDMARIYLTNSAIPTEDGEIPAGTIGLNLSRAVEDGIHEDIDIVNYNLKPVKFVLELEIRSDFADLFEVKDHKFVRRGHIDTQLHPDERSVQTTYVNRDFKRTITYHGLHSDSEPRLVNSRVAYDIELAPGASWHNCHHLALDTTEQPRERVYSCRFKRGETEIDRQQRDWRERTTQLETSNEDFYRAYRQSVEDMGALRLHGYNRGPDLWMPAAGVPWFVTVFGRDSLIVSLQNMLVEPSFAKGALLVLAEFQAKERDDYRDAQPGKILHEIRFGELAHFQKIPHTPYYGTAEATPLYLIILHQAWKWLGDDSLLHQFRDVALGCLDWIDRYGDLDGDGFQEYKTFSTRGYENMGWKDAGDAVVYPDGSQVKQPKALCELQGYVYDAWLRMSEIFDKLGEPERAAELRRKASDLRQRFEERFWVEELGFYAYGLDPEKKQIKTIASNAGHCLANGIADPEHAARVVKRFFEPDMWTGWGIRTLSSRNPAYNPFSYQNGSIWPHDNSFIAYGFKRYGFAAEAAMVAHDILEAARHFVSYRLPELYAGIERRAGTFPVQYLGANVPQAWAAGSIFTFLQAMLGLSADAPNGRLRVNPELPDWLPDVTLRGLKVGNSKLDIKFWREEDRTRWDVLSQDGDIKVEQRALGDSFSWAQGQGTETAPGQEKAA